MSNIKKIAFASVTALGLMVCGPASAGAIITATLLDKGADMEMPKDLGFNMGGDMTKATMGIGLSRSTVAAGHVTFHVLDSSEDMVHEMIVARLKSLDEKLPYLADEEEVDEDRAGDLGEVSELDPGASGELGIDLTEGSYILYCNVPGHYMAGMWTILTVTK